MDGTGNNDESNWLIAGSVSYPSAVVMVDGTGSIDGSNWLIAGSVSYPSEVVMVDGTGSIDDSNWLIAGKRNNGAYQLKYTIFLDSHSIANGPRVPFWPLLHRDGGGRN